MEDLNIPAHQYIKYIAYIINEAFNIDRSTFIILIDWQSLIIINADENSRVIQILSFTDYWNAY